MAVGGYLSAYVSIHAGPKILAALGASPADPGFAGAVVLIFGLIVGAAAAAACGLLIGIPTLRLRGDYLAIATLGLGEIIRVVILNIEAVGGARGLTSIPGYTNFFWVYAVAMLTVAVHWNLVHSRHGRALLAVREDEVAAESLGVPTTRYKVLAFTIGAAFAGMSGTLFGHYLLYLNTNSFSFLKSIEVVIMVVLGGMGSITGSVIAAIVLTVLPELLRPIREYRMVIYSLLLITLMILRPQGLFGTGEIGLGGLRGLRARVAGRARPRRARAAGGTGDGDAGTGQAG
jgi:branched-chain amino acid transport system permease protein